MNDFDMRSLGALGVEVLGFDLSGEISDSVFRSLRSLIIDEGLVLFRDQGIDASRHVELGERFGALENLSPDGEGEAPGLVVIGNVDATGAVLPADSPFMKLISINEGWHTDSSFRAVPASFSLFKAVVVPPEGGDTFFASLEQGWNAIDEDRQRTLYGLSAIHDYATAYRRRGNDSGSIVGFNDPPIAHPLVREHPESRRRVLYISEHVTSIEPASSVHDPERVEDLVAICTADARVYRHQWRAGDFMIWDNRSMLHRAQGFDGRHARVMHHVRIAGEEPPIPARRESGYARPSDSSAATSHE